LRMAAARGDLVAVLSVPYAYHTNDVVVYETQLTLSALEEDPERILSYGVLYHPWIVTPDTTTLPPQSLRSLAPDGGVCGIIASTALSSGSWIAPANIPLSNVVALAPALESGTDAAFAANQINLIAQEPEGFLIMSQDTLMPEGDPLQPLNVRRLLILLRRLALQEGVRYVFQNISPTLQRAITRQFQQWMQQLLLRGAFAGSSAQDSYQVITDATVNTQTGMDQGQFVVELLVAPSVPMQFLTVKLVQSGGQLTAVEV
jgi:phage tail sheath protein FI